jgi:hypothetical protein
VVLYHCCLSLATAQVIERVGFHPSELVRVTDKVPVERLGRDPWESHVIVAIGLPFGFDLDNYPLFKGKSGTVERLIPRSVLNRFSRAVWPD